MRILVDTNVLLRLVHAGHPQQAEAEQAVRRLVRDHHELRSVPQVLYEFWVVATRPADRNGLGFSATNVSGQLATWRSLFPTLRDERGILERWQSLVDSLSVVGKSAHDARLVAAMERHGLTHLLTFNLPDFRRYSSIQLLEPAAVIATI
jgi:predicted nucleic acid-binding protein